MTQTPLRCAQRFDQVSFLAAEVEQKAQMTDTRADDAHDSAMPASHLPVAEVYFYQEIAACFGRAHADAWLTDHSPFSRGPSRAATPVSPTMRSCHAPAPREPAPRMLTTCEPPSGENDELKRRMLQGHGSKIGLLFTDAAHLLFDSSLLARRTEEKCTCPTSILG